MLVKYPNKFSNFTLIELKNKEDFDINTRTQLIKIRGNSKTFYLIIKNSINTQVR